MAFWAVLGLAIVIVESWLQPVPEARWLVLSVGGAVVVIVLFTVSTIRLVRQARRFSEDNVKGLAAIARGELQVARVIFWRWAEQATHSHVSAIARHNLAWTLMRQGELRQAVEVLIDNDGCNGTALTATGMYATSAADLALNYGLLGDVEAAEKWMLELEQRATLLTNTTLPAMKAFTRAVLDCRAGRFADAARLLDDQWVEYEATLTGETLRPLRIVRAFAIASQGPRSAGLVEPTIAMARPAYSGEYDFLGVAWPEMERFLATHRLTRASSRPDEESPLATRGDGDSVRA